MPSRNRFLKIELWLKICTEMSHNIEILFIDIFERYDHRGSFYKPQQWSKQWIIFDMLPSGLIHRARKWTANGSSTVVAFMTKGIPLAPRSNKGVFPYATPCARPPGSLLCNSTVVAAEQCKKQHSSIIWGFSLGFPAVHISHCTFPLKAGRGHKLSDWKKSRQLLGQLRRS